MEFFVAGFWIAIGGFTGGALSLQVSMLCGRFTKLFKLIGAMGGAIFALYIWLISLSPLAEKFKSHFLTQ